ncbi:hypothetical protein V8C44DRAFT_325559 [Trichoderma aethiopicum]
MGWRAKHQDAGGSVDERCLVIGPLAAGDREPGTTWVGEPRTIRATMMTSEVPPPLEERLRGAGARYTRQDRTGQVRYGCGTSTRRGSVDSRGHRRATCRRLGLAPNPATRTRQRGAINQDEPLVGQQDAREQRRGRRRARRRTTRTRDGEGERERRGQEQQRELHQAKLSLRLPAAVGAGWEKKKKEESQGRRARQSSQVPRTQNPRTQNPAAAQQPILPDGESRSRSSQA